MSPEDTDFVERLANRISSALYYGTHGPIGTGGSVSSGLLHDDYDRLRAIVKAERIADLEARLAVLREAPER